MKKPIIIFSTEQYIDIDFVSDEVLSDFPGTKYQLGEYIYADERVYTPISIDNPCIIVGRLAYKDNGRWRIVYKCHGEDGNTQFVPEEFAKFAY